MVTRRTENIRIRRIYFMKAKNASGLVVGVIFTVFVIILVGIIILWTSGEFTSKKKTMDKSTTKIDKAIGSYAEFDLEVYDGKSINGDALVELIKDFKAHQVVVSIGVKTLSTGVSGTAKYYNYGYGTDITPTPILTPVPPTSKADADYINPNGTFLGKVIRNKNDEIVLIEFTQQP
jgi:hypothetical protein